MPKPKQQPVALPDFTRPVIAGGLFLLAAVIIHGVFTLVNTNMLRTTVSKDTVVEIPYPSAGLIELRARVTVDSREAWQTTNLLVEKDAIVQIKVLDGEWTEWKDVREYSPGDGSSYICAQIMKAENCVEPVPDFPSGALIGRIGRQILKIGAKGRFTADQSGALQLRMNDGDNGLYDNNGMLTIEVVIFNK